MRRALSALAFVTLIASPVAAQPQAAPTRAQVRGLLSGFEHTPSAEDWRRVGEGALPHLIALYDDPSEPPYVRIRAVGASAAFPRAAVRTFLLAVARQEGQSDLMAREAVRALGRAFGDAALEDLRPFLTHDEPLVREAAVDALASVQPARDALMTRRRVERDPRVLRSLARALD